MPSRPEQKEFQEDLLERREFREDLQERLERAKERLRIIDAESARLKRLVGAYADVLASLDEEMPTSDRLPFKDLAPPSERMALAVLTVRKAVRTIMEKEKRPMTVREIFDALKAGGKKVGGKVPTDTLRASLRFYESDFQKTPDSKWMLKEESGEP